MDRPDEVYHGLCSDAQTTVYLKNRIDWMNSVAEGPRILDIGCSQGTLTILMGRKGHGVLGVDRERSAIEYAQEILNKESAQTKRNIEFACADFFDIPPPEEPQLFDTVVLGEIIEHTEKPQVLIERALKFLKSGGRIVVTTPFAYHPDPDHRVTFVPMDFLALFAGACQTRHLDVVNGYIRYVGQKQAAGGKGFGCEDLLSIVERGALEKTIVFPAGHISLAVGGKAQKELWPQVTQWLGEHSDPARKNGDGHA